MINAQQFRDHIVIPTLKRINLHSDAAVQLIIGTFWQESDGVTFIKQLGNGPACGGGQCEPATHHDIYDNYLAYKPDLEAQVRAQANAYEHTERYPDDSLINNLAYQVAVCRVHYLRVPAPLPHADDITAMGEYWKKYYNTPLGKGTVNEFIHHFPSEIV